MTEKEIDHEIQKEYDAFNQGLYTTEKLPNDIMERFKKAVFKLPPAAHKLNTEVIKAIVNKKVKELTNFDVPTILNTISQCPLSDLYKDLDEALLKNKEIDNLKISYNILVMQINKSMTEKRERMMKLSGAGGSKNKLALA